MSNLKQRIPSNSNPNKQPSTISKSDTDSDNDQQPNPTPNDVTPPPPSIGQRALTSTGHLANLLPTGTLLAFQLLTPIFTNNGHCDAATRPMTALLLALLASSCFLASFTDSFRAPDGRVHYGFATFNGLWLLDYPGQVQLDQAKYKLRFIDWVHAVLSILVFGVVALRDKNVVNCFYPNPSHQLQEVLDILPIGVGLLCSLLFVAFPTTRHGIGYPVST
ncbi:Protein DMP5 [Bienertia sinuspersici]